MALDDYIPEKNKDKTMPNEPSNIDAFVNFLDKEDQQRIDSIKALLKNLTYGGMIKLAQELSDINGCETESNASAFYKLSNTLWDIVD